MGVLVLALAAAACSSSQPSSSARPRGPSHRPPGGSPGSGAVGSSTVASAGGGGPSGTSASAGRASCDPSGLRGAAGAGRAAAGTVVAVYTLSDVSVPQCTMIGYPTVRLLGPGNVVLGAQVSDGGSTFTNERPLPVELRPGGVASLVLSYAGADAGSGSCSEAQTVAITPPGSTGAVDVASNIPVCPGSRFSVSPVVAGSTPFG